MTEIDFKAIEEKWQKKWEELKAFEADDNSDKPKYYSLEMFPYPSGSGLHMGHAWNYTIGDIIARFKRMQGFAVLHPMGYDALGLPAENAAIEAGTHPEEYNKNSIANFTKQLRELGVSYAWSRMLSTDDPRFYKWDQWIFLKMLEKGLAYKKESPVNWCPKCNTVLANEQVHDGKCWRHEDTEVEVRNIPQWFFKITDYADELDSMLDELEEWPERTKTMQRNWIGRSSGLVFKAPVKDMDLEIETFSTHFEACYADTFVVIAPDHPLLADLVKGLNTEKEVLEFSKKIVDNRLSKSYDDAKIEGIFTGRYIVDPLGNGDLPIWVASYALANYGTGIVKCSAHDKRDFEFAKKYDIPLKVALVPEDEKLRKKVEKFEECYVDMKNGILLEPSEVYGKKAGDSRQKIIDHCVDNTFATEKIMYRLRDWGISRQRYWGTPIPIINCEKCGAVPVPEKDLPVVLPHDVEFGDGNPLETNEDWIIVDCPTCDGKGRRETDTMDTFVNSSWYFMRYCDSQNDDAIFDSKKVNKWCPVDTYIGGAEHACMHLIYARFYTKFLRDLGVVNFDEPFVRLFHQGMLHGEDGQKMSKSKGNGVLPEDVSREYGIDTARFFLSSLASPDKDIDWSDKGIVGSLRFVKKIFELFEDVKYGEDSDEVLMKLHMTIKNIGDYYDNFAYRKATIELRELFDLMSEKGVSKESWESFLKLLSPLCPHIAEELWEKIGGEGIISNAPWPEYDESKLKLDKKEVDLNEKVVETAREILEKLEVGSSITKVYVYSVPGDLEKVDSEKLAQELGKEVVVYSVSDSEKYDPEKKAKRAKLGLPSLFFE